MLPLQATLDQSFRGFARDALIIDAAASTSDDSAYIRRKVCDWIVKFGGEWLLVYDNYDIMELREDDDYNISKYFPLSASGRILCNHSKPRGPDSYWWYSGGHWYYE